MSDFICDTCNSKIPDHLLRATPEYPEGEVRCASCGTRLAMQPQSLRDKALALLGIGVMVLLVTMLFADAGHRQLLGVLGAVVFGVIIMRLHASGRRLLPAAPPSGD